MSCSPENAAVAAGPDKFIILMAMLVAAMAPVFPSM
jgi:hypothetical protein